MRLAVTGHRPNRLGGYGTYAQERLARFALAQLQSVEPSHVLTGMALGWDQAIAEAASILRIPWTAVIPGTLSPQESRWPPDSQARYHALLADATRIERRGYPGKGREFYDRDEHLVCECDLLLALWNGEPSGTGATVRIARERYVRPVWNVWREWEVWR